MSEHEIPQSPEQEQLDYEWRCLLLKHLLRRTSVMRACRDKVEQSRPFSGYPELQTLWHVISVYWDEFQGLLPQDVMEMEMKARTQDVVSINTILSLASPWYAETEFADEYVARLLNDHYKEQAIYDLKESIEHKDIQELTHDLASAARILGHADMEPTPVDTGTGWEVRLEEALKIPLGIPFLDAVLDGGICPGETVGVLGPSGGGKTTLGMQMGIANAAAQQHVIYESSEQRLRGDLTMRICCRATNLPRSKFTNKDGTINISPDAREKMEEYSRKTSQYFHFVDISPIGFQISNIHTLFLPVQRLKAEGKDPSLLIIDWWGRIRDKLILESEARSDSLTRLHNRNWLHEIKQYAEEYQIRVVVFHQLSGEEAEKAGRRRPSSHAAQEDKNFNNMFDFCFTMSRKDSENHVKLYTDKARSTANRQVECILDGENCVFLPDPNNADYSVLGAAPDNTPGKARTVSKMENEIMGDPHA